MNKLIIPTLRTFLLGAIALGVLLFLPAWTLNIMAIGVPLALGSWWGLAIIALVIPVLMWRILDEEQLLKKDLPGYIEYTQKVRHRLVSYLW